jgi:hypothetical protein
MTQKKIPDWVAPVAGIGIAAGIVTAVVAYAASKGTFDETLPKDASGIDIAKLKAKKISTFIIEQNHIENLTDTSFSMKHGGDYVVFVCPYDYDSVKIYRSDIIDGKETRSTITLNKGETKKITLTESGRNVDMFFTLAEPATVDEDITWDPEARPHGTWWYLIGITAGGKYGYKTINPKGVESKFKGAVNRADAEAKAKAEIEAAGGTASTVTDVYITPPLEKRLVSISDKDANGYRIEVWSNPEPTPSEHSAYWRVTKPSGEVVGPNGADSIIQATDTANTFVRSELPVTTETIPYRNYKIELTENPAGTPPFTAKIYNPAGQRWDSAAIGNSRDAVLNDAKKFIDSDIAKGASAAAAYQKQLDDRKAAEAAARARGPVTYEYNRYTVRLEASPAGTQIGQGIKATVYSPSGTILATVAAQLTEAAARSSAQSYADKHWASLTQAQKDAEISAYNVRTGKATPAEKTKEQQVMDLTATMITKGKVDYKGHQMVWTPRATPKASYTFTVYDSAGVVILKADPTYSASTNVRTAVSFIDKKTGTAGFSGPNGYVGLRYTGYKTGYDTPEVKIIAVDDKTNRPVLSMQKIFGGQYVLLKHSGKGWIPVGMFGSMQDLNIAVDLLLQKINMQEVQNQYSDVERLMVESARAQRTGRSVVVRPGVVMSTAGRKRR